MPKKIVTIGFSLPHPDCKEEPFESKASLLDWDIVLFRPDLPSLFYDGHEDYKGRACLTDHYSFRLKEATAHWHREIKQAVEAGKTVVVFLPTMEELFVATGEVRYAGSTKTARGTRIVGEYNNYLSIPAELKATAAEGKRIKIVNDNESVIAPYWAEFGALSEFKAVLALSSEKSYLVTKVGDKAVGGILRSASSLGSLVLLPDMDFYADAFFQRRTTHGVTKTTWTDAAKQFASRLVAAVVQMDKALRSSSEVTPQPAWAAAPTFQLSKELELERRLLDAEKQVEEAQARKEEVQAQLVNAGALKGLLFETGRRLEGAVVLALRVLGFTAENYQTDGSEFDVVFSSEEGRLLGEAEGKDSKAINVEKLRQLSMNIMEDLQRDEVTAPAKPVLFGNAFRLTEPNTRPLQFTEKCVKAAEMSSTALVATSELFEVARYLSDNNDPSFSKACRLALLRGVGVIVWPAVPQSSQTGQDIEEASPD